MYCICDPVLKVRGGGRCVGFRKVWKNGGFRGCGKRWNEIARTCLDMIILAMDTGTSVWYIAGTGGKG